VQETINIIQPEIEELRPTLKKYDFVGSGTIRPVTSKFPVVVNLTKIEDARLGIFRLFVEPVIDAELNDDPNCKPPLKDTLPPTFKFPERVILFNSAFEPDTTTFFQFGILFKFFYCG
jgi:hypothetical protein